MAFTNISNFLDCTTYVIRQFQTCISLIATQSQITRTACDIVAKDSQGKRFIFIYPGSDNQQANPEEIVFRCQGFVTNTCLPPVVNELPYVLGISTCHYFLSVRARATNVKEGVRQFIELTGLGAPSFDHVVAAHWNLMDTLTPFIGDKRNVVSAWRPSYSVFQEFPTMQFANRYFTTPAEQFSQQTVSFNSQIDPLDILSSYGEKHDLLHLEDNEVQYYERHGTANSFVFYQNSIRMTALTTITGINFAESRPALFARLISSKFNLEYTA